MSKKIIPVVLAVIKNGNRFLLTKRIHSDKRFHDKWQLPGGELEFGEKLEDALSREIREELNVDIKVLRFLGNVFSPITDDWHGILFPFLCELKNQNAEITLDHEASEFGWFSLKDIKRLNLLEYTFKIAELASN